MFDTTEESMRAFWMSRIKTCADLHTQAIQQAKDWPGTKPLPTELTTAVLGYGTQLDHAIMTAMEHGAEIEDIIAVSGLHPMYVEDLTRMGRL